MAMNESFLQKHIEKQNQDHSAVKLREYFIKWKLREKYAAQLKRNKNLSIHTAEGWNDFVRVGNSRNLIDQCVEPTEENLRKYQEEVDAYVQEMLRKYPPKPIEEIPPEPTLKPLIRNKPSERAQKKGSSKKTAQAKLHHRKNDKRFSKLRAKIIEMRYTHLELAEMLGISGTTFSNKITGKSAFTYTEMGRLIKILGIPLEESGRIVFDDVFNANNK